jgi:hypothetical protein
VLRSPWTAALLIAVAAAGVALPWQREFGFSERGWSFNEGLIALVAAFEAAIVCALRLAGRIRLWSYVALGLCCATAGFGAVVWFHITVVGEVKPTVYPLLVWWLNGPLPTSNRKGRHLPPRAFRRTSALLRLADLEHRRAAHRALALRRRLAVLHRRRFSVLHLALRPALQAVGFHESLLSLSPANLRPSRNRFAYRID